MAHRLAIMSADFELLRFREHDLDSETEEDIAYQAWNIEMQERILDERFESAYHCIMAAALGSRVFEGVDRLCPGHLEGLPVGLICSPEGVMNLVQVLYAEMSKRKLFKNQLDPFTTYSSWKIDGVDILASGTRVARILTRQHNLHYHIAALAVMAIADWANNYRRFAVAA